ncbi:MAG: glycosyltransferase family 39 protein [Candidatus Aminicenantes bacterium]
MPGKNIKKSFQLSIKSFFQDNYLLLYLALIKLVIHFISNGFFHYGYFRDELYYLACSDHLAWGYVDQPPLSIFLLAISRLFFGDSIFALRLFPALAGAATVFLTGLIVRRLGGGKFAQVMAALAVIASPAFLSFNTFFSMNAFDILFWALGFYFITLIINETPHDCAGAVTPGRIKTDKTNCAAYRSPMPWGWFWLGLVIGLGLLNKISMIWFIGGFVIGLLLTPHRKKILTSGPWLAALAAAVLFIPHIIWQIINGFPTLEFIRNATTEKMATVPFLQFISSQINMIHPVIFLLCLIGLLYFLLDKQGKQYRLFAWMYLVIFLLLMLSRTSRPGYFAPFYPILIAGGTVVFETFTNAIKWRRWLRPIYLTLIIAVGIIVTPLTLPILPVETYTGYAKVLGEEPSTAERKELGKLGQFYADMHGWEKLVKTIAGAYHTLSTGEKQKCTIFTNNYGEAGAIDFFGPRYSLPPAISGHNNYWLWGPGNRDIEVVIHLGGQNGPSLERLKSLYKEVKHADTFTCDYCMPYENNMEIFLCKGPKVSIKEIWPRLKHYD